MLEARTATHARRPAAAGRQNADNSDFARNNEGRMIIRDEEAPRGIVLDITLLQHALSSAMAVHGAPSHSCHLISLKLARLCRTKAKEAARWWE
jgi:hypothetical protein